MQSRDITRQNGAKPGGQPDWPTHGLSFGGDYNPEQWSWETILDDIRLMKRANVNLVTLGVFSWVLYERHDGEFDFSRLDRTLDLLHENGIAVDLATPTAAVPMWLHRLHPEILPQDEFGHPLAPGGRLGWCPSSPVFWRFELRIVERLARHVAGHPAIRMWHVCNEFGGGNARCHCPASNEHFRAWVAERYGTVEALNDAWGMSVWGNLYTSFEQVTTPSGRTTHNPGQLLDYERFSSEALLEHYRAERDILKSHMPAVPVTTNFMVGLGPDVVDYARWAPETDIVANDHYPVGADPLRHQELAFSADRMRGLSHGGPWMLMEHPTSAASWYAINRAKQPGELARHAYQHVARGSDSVMFFQWRASRFGTEQFHSAMVPHAGADTRIFREIEQLGAQLARLGEVRGSQVVGNRVALLHDNEAGWALKSGLRPVNQPDYAATARAIHRAFYERAITVDILPAWADLTGYDLVVVPGLFLVSDRDAARITAFAERGGTVLVTWFSGIVDPKNTVITGGYPGAFRELLGVFGEEFQPLLPDETLSLDNGWTARRWSEALHVTSAEAVASYSDGDTSGLPAITRRVFPSGGAAWYLSTDLEPNSLASLIGRLAEDAGVTPAAKVSTGIEAVRRGTGENTFLFLLDHSGLGGTAAARGVDLLTGARHEPSVTVPAGGVVVLKEDAITQEHR